MSSAALLTGLPPYGPPAQAFPAGWGRLGREGIVARFSGTTAEWVVNFEPGIGGLTDLRSHPDGRSWVVLARGAGYVIDADTQTIHMISSAVSQAWDLPNPRRLVVSHQDLSFECFAATGLSWRTRRLSWDGFTDITVAGDVMCGLAWDALDDTWKPFSVDLRTGRSSGGAESALADDDPELLA